MKAVDCQSFAGGFSLGVVQAGFELVGKREFAGAFGAPAMEGNRHLLGKKWALQDGPASSWEPVTADFTFGNPPCSGFSNLSNIVKKDGQRYKFKDVGNPINDCMDALIHYGVTCGSRIIAFESVQAAGKVGREKMQGLHARVEAETGEQWTLTHTFHNNLSCGGFAMRKRYFCVLARVPFGVTHNPPRDREPTLRDAIGDLQYIELGSIEGHVTSTSVASKRVAELASRVLWNEGERSGVPYQRFAAAGWELENGKTKNIQSTHQFCPLRWRYDRPANVIDGGSLETVVHPELARTLTHREVARIMGFPDTWAAEPFIAAGSAGKSWWGKGIPVTSGQWLAGSVLKALRGHTKALDPGAEIGEREFIIDTTNDWKAGAVAPVVSRLGKPTPRRILRPQKPGTKGARIVDFLALHPGTSVQDTAAAIGCSTGRVQEILREVA